MTLLIIGNKNSHGARVRRSPVTLGAVAMGLGTLVIFSKVSPASPISKNRFKRQKSCKDLKDSTKLP